MESLRGRPLGFVGAFRQPVARICFFHFMRRFCAPARMVSASVMVSVMVVAVVAVVAQAGAPRWRSAPARA